MKACGKCSEVKQLAKFNKRKASKDGHRSECRECQREAMRKYRERNPDRDMQYYEENKQAISLAKKRDYRDNPAKYLKWRQGYYERNKESVALSNAVWRENNPDKMREYRRTYKDRNRDKIRVSEANREAAKRSLINTLSKEGLDLILKTFNRECVICGTGYEHLDHFIPLSSLHGGTHKGNIVPKCSGCNVSKQARNPFEWADSLSEEKRKNFDKVVEYLAEINGLTVEKYREFVYWCFDNKRDVDEITEENKDSLELWLRVKDAA